MAANSFIFEIGGINFANYLQEDGLTWTRNDIDGPNAGRSISGLMIRDRVTTKIRLDATCRPLTQGECALILNAILPEYVTVHYIDPMDGDVTRTMYSNNNPAVFSTVYDDGTVRFTGITFPLIER